MGVQLKLQPLQVDYIRYKQNGKKSFTAPKKWICRYNILQDGKHVETGILGWKAALAHAERYTTNIFKEHIVEILNLWTGELVTYQQALSRAAKASNAVQ